MNHDILKRVIFDQHETIKKAIIYERDYYLQNGVNYVLVGLRRSGKSTLLYKKVLELVNGGVDWNRIIYINFEDERLLEFNYQDFDDIIQTKNELTNEEAYYFFDEIQNVDYWEKFARRMADSYEHVNITGSNSKMLSSEINSTLGGRYITKFIMPYSFKEYINVIGYKESKSNKSKSELLNITNEYLKNGGLPATIGLIDKSEYIRSVYEKVFLNDVLKRNTIRNENAMRILIKKLSESVKDEISFNKIYNILNAIGFKISKDTIIDYIEYILKSNLLFEVKNYYQSFVDKESTPKYYFMDNGILNLFLFEKECRLLENAVAIYLKRKSVDFYYLKSNKIGIDIDFYIPDTNTLIQVAYSISDYDTEKREISSFNKWNDINSELIIVTYSEKKEIVLNEKTIKIIPIYEFLNK